MTRNLPAASAIVVSTLALASIGIATLSPIEDLGKNLFFDTDLSTPPGQSCAACHAPEAGFTGPVSSINATTVVYPGAVHARFGNRKPPTSAYASFSPPFHYDPEEDMYVGGQFWDGRASDLVEQAKGPFLNPLEQNNPNAKKVCIAVAHSGYAMLFEDVFGPGSLDYVKDVNGTYHRIATAIAAYEASAESDQFTSKFDYYQMGLVDLTPQELWGKELFEGKGKCAECHPSTPGPYADKALFTDYTYDNLGIPRNPANPFYRMPKSINPLGAAWVDLGLYWTTGRDEDKGLMKVPTLRNVDKRPYPGFVKAYGHNGYFKSLKEIVHFYNTRDVPGAGWPPPEVPENVNVRELGNLGLTDEEEDAIVAFLTTLSDGYVLSP
ncbi:MAG: cytochrome b6 [Fimbriimonadales bacterium]